jgi:hypothetical protein
MIPLQDDVLPLLISEQNINQQYTMYDHGDLAFKDGRHLPKTIRSVRF